MEVKRQQSTKQGRKEGTELNRLKGGLLAWRREDFDVIIRILPKEVSLALGNRTSGAADA